MLLFYQYLALLNSILVLVILALQHNSTSNLFYFITC